MAVGVGRVTDMVVPNSTPQAAAADQGAPAFTTQPLISVASGLFLNSVSASDGVATNAMQVTRRWLLDGNPVGRARRLQLAGMTGSLVLEVTAYGPAGQTTVTTSPAISLVGGAVAVASPLGPTSASFVAGANPGTQVLSFTGLQSGETITAVSPNDGRLAISGGGTAVVVGLTSSSVGTTNYTFTSSAGRTLSASVQATSGTTTLVVPANFKSRWNVPFTFTRTSSAVYASSFNPALYIPAPTVTYYVDPVNGNDSAAGARATPLKSWSVARGKSDVDQIRFINMTAPFIARSTAGFGTGTQNRFVATINENPQYRYINANASGTLPTWSQNATYPKVNQCARGTAPSSIVDTTLPSYQFYQISGGSGYAVNDVITLSNGAVLTVLEVKTAADGQPDGIGAIRVTKITKQATSLVASPTATGGSGTGATFGSSTNNPPVYVVANKVADLATCAATLNSYYDDGTNTYYHTIDDRVLAASSPAIINCLDNASASFAASGSAGGYFEGIDFVGGAYGFLYNVAGNTTNPTFTWNNCSYQAASSNGTGIFGKCTNLYHRCGAYYNRLDNFNLHCNPATADSSDPTASPVALYQECVTIGGGTTGAVDPSSNEFTEHDYCAAVMINCNASGSDDRVIAPVGDSRLLILGGMCGSARNLADNPCDLFSQDTTQVWVDGMAFVPQGASGGRTFLASSGSTINYRNLAFTPTNPNGGGTLAQY